MNGCDLEQLRGRCHVIAVKASMFDLPWADCGAGIDFPRFREWIPKFNQMTMPIYWGMDPEMWRKTDQVKPPCVTFLRRLDGFDVSDNPAQVYSGGTSGCTAIGVAVLKRAKHIFLFGYDYKPAGDTSHHNDQHYGTKRTQNPQYWSNWARSYRELVPKLAKRGITVTNVSPQSAIECFPKVTFAEALERMDRLRSA